MVVSIARQSVILKCLRQKSVLLGNYEFYYLAGLLENLYSIGVREDMRPQDLLDYILERLPQLEPKNDQEKYLLKLVEVYLVGEEYDEQMKILFHWGQKEPDMWKVETSHMEEEFS